MAVNVRPRVQSNAGTQETGKFLAFPLATSRGPQRTSIGSFFQRGQARSQLPRLSAGQRAHAVSLRMLEIIVTTKKREITSKRICQSFFNMQFSGGCGAKWNHLSSYSSLDRRKNGGKFQVTARSSMSKAGSVQETSDEGRKSDRVILEQPEGPHHHLVVEDPTMGMSAKVEDYMTRNPICFFKDMPLRVAAQIFLERGVGGAPVVEPYEGDTYGCGQLVGILSRKDLIWKETRQGNEADNLYKMPFYWNYLNAGPMMENLRRQVMKIMSTTVEDSMNSSPISVDASTPVSEAAELMLNGQISRLPVVAPRADGKPGKTVIGVLTGNDILKHVMLLL